MTVQEALKALFDEIMKFVKALFDKEVGDDIVKELEGAWDDITK